MRCSFKGVPGASVEGLALGLYVVVYIGAWDLGCKVWVWEAGIRNSVAW